MNTVTANGLVLLAWGLAIFLVYQMLSGPFDGGICETTCFTLSYFGALVLAVLGTLLSAMQAFRAGSGIFSKISLLLGLLLTAKLAGVMIIGMMFT